MKYKTSQLWTKFHRRYVYVFKWWKYLYCFSTTNSQKCWATLGWWLSVRHQPCEWLVKQVNLSATSSWSHDQITFHRSRPSCLSHPNAHIENRSCQADKCIYNSSMDGLQDFGFSCPVHVVFVFPPEVWRQLQSFCKKKYVHCCPISSA